MGLVRHAIGYLRLLRIPLTILWPPRTWLLSSLAAPTHLQLSILLRSHGRCQSDRSLPHASRPASSHLTIIRAMGLWESEERSVQQRMTSSHIGVVGQRVWWESLTTPSPFGEDVAVLRNLQLSHRGDVLLAVPVCPTPYSVHHTVLDARARARDQQGHDRTLCLA